MGDKKLLNILGKDRGLLAMFSGIVLSGVTFICVAVTASIWYL